MVIRVTVSPPTAIGPGGVTTQGENAGNLKIVTDKQTYKAGDTLTVTISGTRPQSLVEVILLGPAGPPLDSKQLSSDTNGSVQYTYQLIGAEAGMYKVVAKQDTYTIRTQFQVSG